MAWDAVRVPAIGGARGSHSSLQQPQGCDHLVHITGATVTRWDFRTRTDPRPLASSSNADVPSCLVHLGIWGDKSGMHLIHALEIKYFRSIYSLKLDSLKHLNILAGSNDAGKSNILKALNLFFNSETDYKTPIDFYRDFNIRRLEEVKRESIKGKQFISIRITFNRGNRFVGSLPERFTVTRQWFRDSTHYTQTDDFESPTRREPVRNVQYARRFLTQFLNNIRYEYIPAIKESRVFDHVLGELQRALYEAGADIGIEGMMDEVAAAVGRHAQALSEDFALATGIRTQLTLPKTVEGLYKVSVDTEFQHEPGHSISLDLRGDGIRTRYIPSILHYIATKSKKMYIWGFEEPESSVEYRLATQMAHDFAERYSGPSQVFVSTHSPAFISLHSKPHVTMFRVVNKEGSTRAIPYTPQTRLRLAEDDLDLMSELGLTELLDNLHQRYQAELAALNEERKRLVHIKNRVKQLQRPILLTEGKTDASILRTAWKKLYGSQPCPFAIEHCDPLPDSDGGAGGVSVLKKHIESVLPGNPFVEIALFDRDKAGIDSFNKLAHFENVRGLQDVKVHKNKRAYAVLLPVPPGLDGFTKGKARLTLEFYFAEHVVRSQTPDGRGLIVRPLPKQVRIGDAIIKEEPATEWFWHEICRDSDKVAFAEEIVPNIEQCEFTNFRLLFDLILRILDKDKQWRSPVKM